MVKLTAQPPDSASRLTPALTRRWILARPWRAAVVAASAVLALLTGTLLGGSGSAVVHLVASVWLAGVTALLVLEAYGPGPVSPRALWWPAWSMPAAVVAGQLSSFGTDPRQWDLMWVSAWLAFACGWALVRVAPERLRRMLRRLGERRVLDGDEADAGTVLREMDRVARRWAWVSGCGVGIAFVTTGPWAGLEAFSDTRVWPGPFGAAYFVPALLAVIVIGAWLGRMAAYGRLGTVVPRQGARLRVIPDHPDGAGGLRPVGDFYLYQSRVAALPAIFIIVWLVFVTLAGDQGFLGTYRPYVEQFRWQLPLMIFFEVLAFVVPMRSIHAIMRREKETTLWSQADEISRQIEDLRARSEETPVEDLEAQQARLAALVRRFKTLEATPTWPVDASIRRRFTLRNLGLVLPLVGYLFGEAALWGRLADLFTGLE